MSDPTFMADPTRLVIAAIVGIALLLALIIKLKLHPVLSMMVSALTIGIGAGMPLDLVADTVTKGVGTTLQNIALLIGLGSMFGQILEESGGAKKIAQTFIDTFGQGHSSWALGITGLVIGTTVFFEAGVVVLIPLAFSVASQTKKSTLYYGIALLAGLAAGYAFVPPSAGSVLVAGTLGVDLGTMILVGIPTAFIAMAIAGVIWGRNVGGRIFTDVPEHFTSAEGASDEKELPSFGMVLAIVLTPLCLILLGTLSSYIPMPAELASILAFLGKPFVALTLATLVAMYLLGARGYGPLAALGTAALGGGALIALTAARNRKMSSRTALLTVQRAGRRVSLVAIVDTGNALVEPLSNLPVIVVEKDALSGVAGGRMRAVPFTSVGGGGVLSAFAPDSVRVDGREVEAFVAVYDGVLNTEGRALIPGRCMG